MNENQNPAIELRGVDVSAMRDVTFRVVEDVNWTVAAGEFWVVAGQQHSGKSDLLMMMAGLMLPSAGVCKHFGKDTRTFDEAAMAERLRSGFVFEKGQLFGQLTIAENIALPLRYHRDLTTDAADQEVRALLERLELTPLADITPANVSANWLKRAALARALILKPQVLLLDNPFGGLGLRHSQWWLRFLDQLWRGHEWLGGRPMTVVTTTDDLLRFTQWKNDGRRFALLRDKRFFPLGAWNEVEASNDAAVKELLVLAAEPAEAV
jgi:ABC-type transporter Mla maintaining outer membrane lipid asymmetry ATPase subunit MlaF